MNEMKNNEANSGPTASNCIKDFLDLHVQTDPKLLP